MMVWLKSESAVELFFDKHSTTARVAVLGLIFVSGYFDAAFLKNKSMACATWFPGLLALAIWIGFPLTPFRIIAGAMVFASGMALMVRYYRS